MGFLRIFSGDAKGSLSIFFALAMAGFVAAIGVATDMSRQSDARSRLQSALDAAILSAGKVLMTQGGQVDRAMLISDIKANLPANLQSLANNVEIVQTTDRLSVKVTGSLGTLFGPLHGRPNSSITAAASVEATSRQTVATRIELALVLDSTLSMIFWRKMEKLKVAANQLVDALVEGRQPGSELAIGVVPFTTMVRIDPSLHSQPWITLRKGNAIFDVDVNPATWGGCVTDRDKPYNALRSPPNPDRETEKYRTKPCSFFELKLQPILPLTTDIALVRSRIASIEPWGLTNTTIGMAWGLNILNPSAPLGDAAAPASRKPIRMMVFLTDGLNNNDRFWQPFWDMDNDMRSLCRDARSSDVRIFTVRVVEGNDSLLRDCASDPVDFYQVNDADELEAVFRAIAGKIGETVKRLRLAS